MNGRQLKTKINDFRYYTDYKRHGEVMPNNLSIGEKEVIFSASKAIDRATRLMPIIQAEIIPDAGHTPYMDQPEMVNKRILKFLKE